MPAQKIATPNSPSPEILRALKLVSQTLEIEAQALLAYKKQLDLSPQQGIAFSQAIELLLRCPGHAIVMGMGKSGHVGRKIAATLSSTGTPAFFVHPAEAAHGDLGMVTANNVVIALSYSGESEELAVLLPLLQRNHIPLIAITGHANSSLAKHAQIVLNCHVEQEACPLNLAPTSSTTLQLALGDALAVALLDARGFGSEDFARSHPGGSLGRRLLTRVQDIMRTGAAIPEVQPDTPFINLMEKMSAGGLGLVVMKNSAEEPIGIFTDGDLRRELQKGVNLLQCLARDLLQTKPKTISQAALATDAASLMETHRITSILAVDAAGRLAGIVNANDLLRAKIF